MALEPALLDLLRPFSRLLDARIITHAHGAELKAQAHALSIRSY